MRDIQYDENANTDDEWFSLCWVFFSAGIAFGILLSSIWEYIKWFLGI